MTREEFFEYCTTQLGTEADYPFEGDTETAVMRHKDSRKWFAIVMRVPLKKFGIESEASANVVNLKLPTEMYGSFGPRDGVYPAYHMNKLHWVSVILSDANDGLIRFLTETSYDITKKKKPKGGKK